MPKIYKKVVVHKLSANPHAKKIYQKHRIIALERQKVINEISKLLLAEFIFKIDYPKWLANVVLVISTMENKGFV